MGTVLLRLHQHELPGNIGKADLLLERLRGVEPELITQEQSRNILLAFSKVLDVAHEQRALDLDWVRTLWDRANALIPICLSRLGPDARSRTIRTMFEDGEALGWLTSVMRRETFAHGRYGDRPKPEADWLVSNAELGTIFDLMKARFEAMSADQLLSTSRPIDILFAWRQAGDEEAPRELIEKFAREPEGLVIALEKMTSIRNSSDRGTYSVLTRSNIESFLNFDETREMVIELASSEHPMASRAAALANAYDDDDIFG